MTFNLKKNLVIALALVCSISSYSADKDDKPRKPFLILTVGATGSGKSTLLKMVTKKFDLKDVVEILVDDLVENDPYYKNQVKKIFAELCVDSKCQSKDQLKNIIEKADDSLYKKFGEAYFSTRKKFGCKRFGDGRKNCDQINDDRFKQAIDKRKNIVVEMTGQYFPGWIFSFNNSAIAKHYNVVLSYSLVNYCELIKRNKGRAVEQSWSFLEDESLPAPRLPLVKDEKPFDFKKNVINMRNVLALTTKNCLVGQTANTQFCGPGLTIYSFLVYDNNGRPMRLIYERTHPNKVKSVREIVNILKATPKVPAKDKTCSE